MLPIYEEIMQFYLFVQNNVKPNKKSKELTTSKFSAIIEHRLEVIWNCSFILIVSRERILQITVNQSSHSNRVASGPGISGILEETENFVPLRKSQGIS